MDVDLEKIRVLSRRAPQHEELQHEGVGEQGREEGQEEIQVQGEHPLQDQQQEGAGPQGQDQGAGGGQEEAQPLQGTSRVRLSPRARKKAQADAKFKRKMEPLRTVMAIKERWILEGEETE